MDADRFDGLTRRLTLRPASRRLVIAAPVVALSAGLVAETAGAKQRCAKSQRCGKDCCGKSKCFPKKIDPNNGQIVSFGCCPAKSLCRAPVGDPDGDQCCYSDEQCDPTGDNNGNGLCCRTCGAVCCSSAEFCNDGACSPIGTARLPRRRP